VEVIEQTALRHVLRIKARATEAKTAAAIRDKIVRGAALIGATSG